ncbi:MAG: exosortase/archaeosortase family protein [Gemmataceae bacterium]|nr:exosortase/archaeosortase family protein [Gemmataceae bacterium]
MDDRPSLKPVLIGLALVSAVLGWSYWTTFLEVGERWITDPQYQHGFLVPLFSAYLLWRNRDRVSAADFAPRWWGVGIVAAGLVLRLAGAVFYQPWLDTGSLLVVLAGMAAAVGGRRVLVWAAPGIVFLAFMMPLPYRFQTMLGGTLQAVATKASTYALQTIGVSAVPEGNVILLTETRLGVVEACNGLSMLVTFFAIAAGFAILVRRSVVERVAIVASAVPIAVAANVVRIVLTGVLFEMKQGELANRVFHDFAGLLMMPVALFLLWAELLFFRGAVTVSADDSGR